MSDFVTWLRGLAEKGGKGVVNNIDARCLGRIADELERLRSQAENVEPVAWQFKYKGSPWQNTHTDCKPDFTLVGVEYRPLYAAPQSPPMNNDWKEEAIRRFGPIPPGQNENSRLIAGYHYAFIEGAKAALSREESGGAA